MKKSSPWKAEVLALLCVLTAVSLSLASSTVAKYTASATVAASARVAKWDIWLSEDIKDNTKSTAHLSGAHFTTQNNGPTTKTFKITNNSEVMAEVTIKLVYVDTDVSKGTVGVNSTQATVGAATQGVTSILATGTGVSQVTASEVYRLAPAAVATFTITMKNTTNPSGVTTTNCMRRYKVYFKAVQVD